jgi:hypothetical protein
MQIIALHFTRRAAAQSKIAVSHRSIHTASAAALQPNLEVQDMV